MSCLSGFELTDISKEKVPSVKKRAGDLRHTPKTIGRGHFGGQLVFVSGGKLFITSGDRQRFDPAQDLGCREGSGLASGGRLKPVMGQ